MSKVINSDQSSFKSEVLDSKVPVLVDFWAPWCRPCLMMAPILDEVSEELSGKLKIVKVNVDAEENQVLGMEYQIRSIPNMKLFKNGKVVHEIVGLLPGNVLIKEIEPFCVN